MSYQHDTASALAAATAITTITGTRIFADVADGGTTTPYLVYQFVSTDGETTHDGTRDVEFPLVQFSCWASTKAGAVTLGNTLAATLDGKTIAGTSAASFRFSNRFGEYEQDTKLYGEILEFRMAVKITN
jgi:hypothetical protein